MKKYVKKQEFEAVQWTGDLSIVCEVGADYTIKKDESDTVLTIRGLGLSLGEWLVTEGSSAEVFSDVAFNEKFKPVRAKKKTKTVEQENA